MSKVSQWLLVGAATFLLLVSTVVVSVWVSMPPDLDPEEIASSLVDTPPEAFRGAAEEARALARSLIAEEKLPGLSLAVAVDAEVVWAEGFRFADLEKEVPTTPATRFRIGGVTETLTAAAVGILAERGRLDLDAPVRHYVPGFPEKEWPVSTRRLMAHAGGLRAYRGEGGIFRGSCATDAERLAIFADEPLHYEPGTEARYSTFGWTLVGAVVAAAAGEPTLDFIQREVLAPLGMESTGPAPLAAGAVDAARFYYPRMMLDPRYGLQDSPTIDLSCHVAAVGFVSTPTDLARFGAAMMGQGPLAAATVEILQTPLPLISGESTGHALGWTVGELPLGDGREPTRIVGQGLGEAVVSSFLSAQTVGGQVAGATTTLLTVPEHGVAVAVSSNVSGSDNVSRIATSVADAFVRRRPASRG